MQAPAAQPAGPATHGVGGEPPREREAVDEVAAVEASRLLRHPVQPLEAQRLNGGGRAPHLARDEPERDAEAEEPGARHVVAQAADEPLLLGRAQADEHDVGLRLVQTSPDGLHLRRVVLEAEGRAVRPRDVQVRVLGLQDVGRGRRGARTAAEEVHGAAGPRGHLAQRVDEARPGDALERPASGDLARPHERHAVGDHEAGLAAELAHLLVVDHLAQDVQAGGDDPATHAPIERCEDPVQHLARCAGVNGDPQQRDPPRLHVHIVAKPGAFCVRSVAIHL